MKLFICSICGFIYDEASGYPDGGISPGTIWNDVPASFVCPLCGASKTDFKEKPETGSNPAGAAVPDISRTQPENVGYSAAELSAVFSNLAKGGEKQYDPELSALYQELSNYYKSKSKSADKHGFKSLDALLQTDLSSGFSFANRTAAEYHDRGALRALKWSEQVSRMISSHLNKITDGSAGFIENTNLYVCEICGFIYVGDEKPEICPICKVPNSKMTQIRRAA